MHCRRSCLQHLPGYGRGDAVIVGIPVRDTACADPDQKGMDKHATAAARIEFSALEEPTAADSVDVTGSCSDLARGAADGGDGRTSAPAAHGSAAAAGGGRSTAESAPDQLSPPVPAADMEAGEMLGEFEMYKRAVSSLSAPLSLCCFSAVRRGGSVMSLKCPISIKTEDAAAVSMVHDLLLVLLLVADGERCADQSLQQLGFSISAGGLFWRSGLPMVDATGGQRTQRSTQRFDH